MAKKPMLKWTPKMTEKLFRAVDEVRVNGIIPWETVSQMIQIPRNACYGKYSACVRYNTVPEWHTVIRPRLDDEHQQDLWERHAIGATQKLLARLIEVHGPNCCA